MSSQCLELQTLDKTDVLQSKCIIHYFLRVQIYPVAGYVDSHAHAKPEGIGFVELAQRSHETHRADSIRQLIQDRTKLGALIVISGRMAVYCVQQRANHVTP